MWRRAKRAVANLDRGSVVRFASLIEIAVGFLLCTATLFAVRLWLLIRALWLLRSEQDSETLEPSRSTRRELKRSVVEHGVFVSALLAASLLCLRLAAHT